MDLIKIYAGIVTGLTLVEVISVFLATEANTGLSQEQIATHAKNLTRSTLMISPLLLRCLEII